MRFLFFLVFFLTVASGIQAQKKARDFTVTTTDLKTIELYRDYLNKGTVVLLKIFFVDCPPCNEIAPQFSQLYKKYGSGKNKVEFIELSNKTWDNNALVIGYKNQYDLPCPSASNDGGSVQAAALYTDNYYGPFYGTPTFIVIKPDGTVNYEPKGSNKNETISKLDTAIAQALRTITIPPVDTVIVTPPVDTMKPPVDTMKPNPPKDTTKPTVPVDTTIKPKVDTIKLSGKLVTNTTGLGLVPITITWNTKEYRFSTDLFGNFKINIPDSGKAANDIKMKIDYNLDYLNLVSAVDLLLIQKHILGVLPFSHFRQVIAADVDLSGNIDVIDLVELRKLLLGLYDKLPKAPSVQFAWQNHNHFIRTLNSNINYSEFKALSGTLLEIQVVKVGNVN